METVSMFWRLSRKELVQTIAENLQWYRVSETNKIDAGLKLLEKLESQGVLQLLEKRTIPKPTVKRAISITEGTEPQSEIACKLKELYRVELEIIKDKDIVALWKQYVSRYHYLGYKRPFGYTLRYFIKSERGRLGCVLFFGAEKSMGVKSQWHNDPFIS